MKPRLNLLDVCMLIIGAMVGSGIFLVAGELSRSLGSPTMVMVAWGINAVMIIFGALSYGELAAAMPQAGGHYIFLREAYGKLAAFLFGWTMFTVVQSGFDAAVSIAFAKYLGALVPAISQANKLVEIGDFSFSTQQLTAVFTIVVLTIYNLQGVKEGALLSNILTFIKIGSLVLIVILAVWLGINAQGSWENFKGESPAFSLTTLLVLGAAMAGPLFSSDAWNFIAFIAGEVKNPQRNIPLGLFIGVGLVAVAYFFVSGAYIFALGTNEIINAPNDRVGSALMTKALGPNGGILMAVLIMISTFGCLNNCIIMGARCLYAIAKDGMFFIPQAAMLNKNGAPHVALIIQGVLGVALTAIGNYGDLLDAIMVAVLIFHALTISAVIKLRIDRPEMPRPYRAIGYPFTPIAYIVLAAWVVFSLFYEKPKYTVPCLVVLLLGVVVYFVMNRKGNTEKAITNK